MDKKDLKDREDIHRMVTTFYATVRKDDVIGPIFNRIIPEEKWPDHLERLTDFWESVALGHYTYVGNPRIVHQEVDAKEHYGITQQHFSRWIHLWFENVDSLFQGPLADHAKNTARKMSSALFIAMYEKRPASQA